MSWGQHQLTLLVIAGELGHGGILAVRKAGLLLNHLKLTHLLWHHLSWHALGCSGLTYCHAMHGCSGLHGLS